MADVATYLSENLDLQVWCVRFCTEMVPPARFQRATFRLGGGRSMQLSYGSTSEEIVSCTSWKSCNPVEDFYRIT